MNIPIDRKPYRYLILLIYLLVNGLFIYKYSPGASILLALGYMFVVGAVYFFYTSPKRGNFRKASLVIKYGKWLLPLVIFIGIFVIKYNLSPWNVKVDRWSALYYWTQELFAGRYPYMAKTHLGQYASPFPIWELVHVPFYFLGDEIFGHIVFLFLLLWLLFKWKQTFDSVLFFLLLILSPSYWWEVAVRSDLMNNLMLAAIFIIYSQAHLSEKKDNINFWILGLVTGLLLCTRLFLIFPFGIYFFSKFVNWEKKSVIQFCLMAILGTLLPIVPFLIWDWNLFIYFPYSPIHLQSQLGGPFMAVAGILFLAFCSSLWKKFHQYFGLVAMVLFCFVMIRLVQTTMNEGWYAAIFNDRFDVSYLNVCLPFALFFLTYTSKKVLSKDGNTN